MPKIRTALFYGAAALFILKSYAPVSLKATPLMLDSLISGSHRGYRPLGSELASFRNFLPQVPRVFLLTDHPYGEVTEEKEFQHAAQNFLCPMRVDGEPGATYGIVYCTSNQRARERLHEAGYRWLLSLSDGKGMIVRKK